MYPEEQSALGLSKTTSNGIRTHSELLAAEIESVARLGQCPFLRVRRPDCTRRDPVDVSSVSYNVD